VHTTIRSLKKINSWALVGLSVVSAVIITDLLTIVISLIVWGRVPVELLVMGTIAATVVPSILAPILIYLVRRTASLEDINQELYREISERKKAQDALRQANWVVENSPVMFFRWKAVEGWPVELVSENVVQLGYTPQDFLAGSVPFAALVHPEDLDRVAREVQDYSARGVDRFRQEYRIITQDGKTRWVDDRKVIERDAGGQVTHYQGIVIDITDRKQAAAEREKLIAELEIKNKELERFTYTVSHDLKAPLITIKGFLGFLEQDALAGNVDRLKADTHRINEAADKMQRLLGELLELSRIGRMMNPPQQVPFEIVVREALDVVHGRLKARGVRVEIAEGLPTVYGDRARLVQVVQNLVDNAAKFMGDRPEPCIEIGTRGSDSGGQPVFFVRDDGIGIDRQYHERIFGLFNKLDAHTEGTGVGLALVKRIVEVHGGRIWVESEGVGKGATFCFTLPRNRDY